MKKILTDEIKKHSPLLEAGEDVLLTGFIYTARDAAHKRIFALREAGGELPFDINGAVIYYAGPTPPGPGRVIGSCGPTTAGRMDIYAPRMYDMGLGATIGKGERSREVIEAIMRNKSVYLCAVGGAGAVYASCVRTLEVIAFDDLGCESVKRLYVENFPVITAVDCFGNSLFNRDGA